MGKITGTLGEGISSLMEQSERKKRRERLNKNTGILSGSKNLARGFFSGVTGLVSKPIEGVKKQGFEGLIKGVGHGVVGLVAQPTTGIIDFTSGTLNQLQRTVNIGDEVKRVRPTRAIHADGILRSYNSHEADGRSILKNLKSFSHNDIYVSHILIAKDRYFMITNKHLLSIKKECFTKSYDVVWHLENTNISRIVAKDRSLFIHLKVAKKVFGLFAEKYVFELVCENNDIVEVSDRIRLIRHHKINYKLFIFKQWINSKLQGLIKTDWEF